jgi:aminoglycoside 3-N-acetyltransferase
VTGAARQEQSRGRVLSYSVIRPGDIERALRRLGVRRRDTLWVHAGLQTALRMEGSTPARKVATVLQGLERTVADGTLIVPTFTYSFTRGEDYDVATSPSTVGVLGEHFRRLPGVRRTADPMFSVAIRGSLPRAWERRMFGVGDTDCFGAQSIFACLREVDAQLAFLGVGFGYCTFLHHVEQRMGVPYRYFKDFSGTVRGDDATTRTTARYYVRDIESGVENRFDPVLNALLQSGAARRTTLPSGPSLLVTRVRAVEAEAIACLRTDPTSLAIGEYPPPVLEIR